MTHIPPPRSSRRGSVAVALALALSVSGMAVALGGQAAASTHRAKATTVNIVLTDTKGTSGDMTMTVTPASVPAGKVKFVVKNAGTINHEMVVLKTNTAFDKLPISNHRVSEAKSVGEVGSVGKGKTKSKVLKLKKGAYVLVCNIAKHYEMGMRAAFTVT